MSECDFSQSESSQDCLEIGCLPPGYWCDDLELPRGWGCDMLYLWAKLLAVCFWQQKKNKKKKHTQHNQWVTTGFPWSQGDSHLIFILWLNCKRGGPNYCCFYFSYWCTKHIFGRFSNSSPHALVRQPNSINLHLCLSNDFIYMAVCISVLGGEYSLPIQWKHSKEERQYHGQMDSVIHAVPHTVLQGWDERWDRRS